MHFVFYPKHEYGCPHVGHCPHLGGASLGTLVLAADEQTEWTDALWRQIDALREEPAATGPKKRGAPVGHPGWYRKRGTGIPGTQEWGEFRGHEPILTHWERLDRFPVWLDWLESWFRACRIT